MARILTPSQRWVVFKCRACEERWPVGDHEREDPWVLRCPNCLKAGVPLKT